MRNRNYIWVALFLTFTIGSFIFFHNKKTSPQTPPPTKAISKSFSIVLNAQNNSLETGIATINSTEDKTVVKIKLVGFPKDVEQKASVNLGNCARIGNVKYSLKNVLNGDSQTAIKVGNEDFLDKAPLAIVVSKSLLEKNVYTSCGEL